VTGIVADASNVNHGEDHQVRVGANLSDAAVGSGALRRALAGAGLHRQDTPSGADLLDVAQYEDQP